MEQRNPRLRWLIVWVLAVVWMAVVLARLSYLQLFSYSEYFTKAQHQQQRVFEISPMRGTIYDRKGRELAVSLPMDSVFGDPTEITDVEMVGRLLWRVAEPRAARQDDGDGGRAAPLVRPHGIGRRSGRERDADD